MADFSALIASIRAQIRANGRQLITGPVMQASLLEIIDAVNAAKQDTLTFDSDPTEDSENPVTSGGVWRITSALTDSLANLAVGVQEGYDELLGRINGKQDIIADLADIRAGALLGSTAYQKPADGIPFEDLTHSVQVSLESADNALKPNPAYDGQIPVYNEDGDIMGSGITPEIVNAKADQDGTYPDLTAGAVLAAAVPAEYLYRPCPAPMDGKAVLDTIMGKTIVSSGQLINNAAEGIKTTGRNQWDEVTEIGGIYTSGGSNNNSVTDRIRAKNYCPCFEGKTYYYRNPTAVGMPIFWYDANKSFLSYVSVSAGGGTVTAPSNAAFFRISFQASYGTTYNHDVCINISDAAFNGQYEPYKESEVSLGLNSFRVTDGTNTITVNGLKSAGSVYDEIKDGKYIKRIGEVDLGTLDYELLSGTVFRSSTTLPAKDLGAYRLVNAINVKYEQKPRSVSYSTLVDKQYKFDSSSLKMYFNDSASSNVEQFKSNNTGIKLYYELATPVEYELVSEIPNSYPVYEGGTEEVLSDAIVAPFCASIRYPASPEGLTIVELLTSLKAASVISYFAVTVDAATSKKTLTITA